MLDRLEHERLSSGRRALAAQERERRRLARELRDELGQVLTGVGLQLAGLARSVPPELDDIVAQAQLATHQGIEDLREIARGLRPGALEDCGLRSALAALTLDVSRRTGLRVERRIEPGLPALSSEEELVIYRVAQEGLTNVARHAGAQQARITLGARNGHVSLEVRDDGEGLRPGPGRGGRAAWDARARPAGRRRARRRAGAPARDRGGLRLPVKGQR